MARLLCSSSASSSASYPRRGVAARCTGGVEGRAGAFSRKDFPNPHRFFSFTGFGSPAFLPPPSSPRSHRGAQPISSALPLAGRRPHEAFLVPALRRSRGERKSGR
uniref:Uncharacterized protein n=1 Tax=Arundo donax TaxID=35708 RepID=A0A0A9B4C0_ARUDO